MTLTWHNQLNVYLSTSSRGHGSAEFEVLSRPIRVIFSCKGIETLHVKKNGMNYQVSGEFHSFC